VRFDEVTDMRRLLEAERYKSPSGETKTLWRCEASEWTTTGGSTVPAVGALTWADEGTPWAEFRAEDVAYNAEVVFASGARELS